ncbi:ABC transporter ATP-binding protein [Vibrio mediterranei]|nr:ABC transporter ATP-binding protein [Vibrio mediterranei]
MLKELLHPLKRKYSRNVEVLKDINIKVQKNEVIGIIGKNGAGKSTLLKLISGVTSPDSGSITVKGRITALLELGAAFNPEYTGRENIYFYGLTQGLSKIEIDDIYQEVVDFADIGHYIDHPVKTYSSGMFARLAFSSAISLKPDLLIVDEILSVGDVFFQQKCMNKMQELIKMGSTVIFVSHDMHAVKFFCDRIIYLEAGKLIQDSTDTNMVLDLYEKGTVENKRAEIEIHNSEDLVNISDTYFVNEDGVRKNRFRVSENISVVIKFEVNSHEKGRFLGFGIRNQENVYVFGVNTKLDGVAIPDKIGEYTATLKLDNVNIYKSVFSCWSVIYDSTGTVAQAKYLIKDAFEVYNNSEICEGILVPNRQWILENRNEN